VVERMRNLTILAVFGIIFLSVFTITSLKVSAGDTITVGPSGPPTYDFGSINDAIANANESDTIYVYSGTYTENIVINKNLSIISIDGSSNTIIISASGSNNTIDIVVDGVTISGFTIRNQGGSFACIKLTSVSNCLIENSIIKNGGNGVYLVSSNNNMIKDNTIENNNVGIYLSGSNSNTIQSNDIRNNNANGVFITSSSSDNSLYLNDFSNNIDNNARDEGSNNWDDGSQGNYWDDYNDYDHNGDGIGDNPYNIAGSGGNKDNYSLGDFLSLNQKPSAYIESISPNPATYGQTVRFDGRGSDDGTIVAWEWRSDGVTISNSEDFETSALSSGTHSISFRVQDNDGEWSSYVYSTLVISDNQKPTAHILNPTRVTYVYGENILFSGSGTDPDGQIVAYSWRSIPSGITSNQNSFTLSNLPVDEYTIYFKVRDNYSDWSQEVSTTLIIIPDASTPNEPPHANAGGPYSGYVNEEITFSGAGSYDLDTGDSITYNWNFGDNATGEGVSPKHTYSAEGNYTVELSVVDNHGEQSKITTYANITTNGGGQNQGGNDSGNKIPGFELIILIIAMGIILLFKKYKKVGYN